MVFNTEIDKLIERMDLTQEPPVKEPERQYWFMKESTAACSGKRAGIRASPDSLYSNLRLPRMNAGIRKAGRVLERIGYVETEDENADFVIYNTCTVRENANLRVYGRLGYLHSLKKKNPHMMIALCGLYDAGASGGGKAEEKLFLCKSDLWHPQYL